MTEFKRAILSLTRRKGKTIILFTVIFIIGNVIAGAIAIQQASAKTEQQMKNALGSVASIGLDYDRLTQEADFDFKNIPELSPETIEKIGAREDVKSFDYNISTFLSGTTQQRYESEDQNGGGMIMAGKPSGPQFSVKGVHDHNILEITEGNLTLEGGRTFTKDEIKNGSAVTLISKEIAELNNIAIGDMVHLKQDISEPFTGAIASMDDFPAPLASDDTLLEVVGIFTVKPKKAEDKKNNNGDFDMSSFMDAEKINTFIVPNGFVAGLEQHMVERLQELKPETDVTDIVKGIIEPTFILKTPEAISKFEEEVKPMLPDFYKLNTSADEYKKIAGPIESLQTMAKMTLIVAIAAGITILGLIMMLFLRERKHEMGIYLSIGAPKIKIITQIILEVVLVAMLAISASLVTGNMMAKSVSASMIKNQQLSALENGGTTMSFNVYDSVNNFGGDVSEEDAVDAFNISMTPQYIMVFYTVGLGTIILSTLVPIIYFLRLKPKEIML